MLSKSGSGLDLNAEPKETAWDVCDRHRDGIPQRDMGRCAGRQCGDDGPCGEIVACLDDVAEVARGWEPLEC